MAVGSSFGAAPDDAGGERPLTRDDLAILGYDGDLAAWGRELLRRLGDSDVASFRYVVAGSELVAVQGARHAVAVEPRDGAQLLGERVTDALDAYRSGARTPLAEFGGDDPVTGERARLAPRVAALLAGRPDLVGGQRLYPWEVCNVADIELGWSIAWVDGAYRLRRRSRGVVSEGAAGPSSGELMDRLEAMLGA
ncbi:hypothetical protein ACH0AH_00020 [Microbacterium paludicola]|uniref:hypothetical protein n=1 Tax=Microbacterium paludicola TaxID=300019 RepID=UPI00387A6D6B